MTARPLTHGLPVTADTAAPRTRRARLRLGLGLPLALLGFGLAIGVWYSTVDVLALPRFAILPGPSEVFGEWVSRDRRFAEGYGFTAEAMRRYWDLYLGGADGTHPDASPLRADDLRALPPAFVATAEADVLRDEGEAYAHALRAAGVRATLRRYPGTVHGFWRWLARAQSSRRAVGEVGAALRAALSS